mmetsp:Transcript_11123/g.33847  ORF Transcript_11123/g.33847 Transcript_11123/m.33847 type:complete len:202 (-) Transcript_11123:35-640(-)
MTMPSRTAPGTACTMRLPVRIMPASAAHIRGLSKGPRPMMVVGLATTMSTLTIPMREMSRPMPTTMASFTVRGVMRMMSAAMPVTLQSATRAPAMSELVSACEMLSVPGRIKPNAMYTERPVPGASPSGKFEKRPLTNDPTAEPRAVATTTASEGSPAWLRICGLTSRMYDCVKKMSKPPRSSVITVEPRRLMLNQLSMAS